MKKSYKIVRRIAFVISIIFAVFLSIFAFDVFSEGYTFVETLVALFMHLIPTFVLVAVILIARKSDLIGGLLFVGLSLASLVFFRTYNDIFIFLLISFPPLVFATLFLVAHKLK